jgi:hypothetical protein
LAPSKARGAGGVISSAADAGLKLSAASKVAWIGVWDRVLTLSEFRELFEYLVRHFAGSGVRIGQ